MDILSDFERSADIAVYGFAQGYFDISKVLEELREKGTTKIPFKWCYDARQYLKNYNGCYMEIIKE